MLKLVCGNQELEVTFLQAQNILQIQAQMKGAGTHWQLDSKEYEFKDNGIIKRANKKSCRDQAAQKRDTKGSKPPAKTEISHSDNTE